MSATNNSTDEEQASYFTTPIYNRQTATRGRIRSSGSSYRGHTDEPSETTSLLGTNRPPAPLNRSYSSPDVKPDFARRFASRSGFRNASGRATPRHHARARSWGSKFAAAMSASFHRGVREQPSAPNLLSSSLFFDERVWYDQFTVTDWVHDSIADNFRLKELRSKKGFRGRILQGFDAVQGWILAAIVGVITAFIAYFVDFTENAIFDIKEGYCMDGWHKSKGRCCLNEDDCPLWRTWGSVLELHGLERRTIDFLFYVAFVVLFTVASCLLTLTTRTVVPSNVSLPTFDENLGAEQYGRPGGADTDRKGSSGVSPGHTIASPPGPMIYYPAAGSGVAEVKVILSGFIIHGYLGVRTLFIKTFALILSVASGLSLGKEGPFVHIATCVGNVAARFFPKYNTNDGKRREVLSASAASGVAVAFGAPIAGTLFSLEEVSYYFPTKTLFRTFFCCIIAALSLKFFDPYGTGKIVIFEVRYISDWNLFEVAAFVLLGILGGGLGALFIKATGFWARSFRRISFVKRMPVLEVVIVALISGCLQFWNKYTKASVTQLMFELASPCRDGVPNEGGLCPKDASEIGNIVSTLAMAFVIKSLLTTITFGIKVPAGIYVPSMVVGGLMGRIVGHGVQYLTLTYPTNPIWARCAARAGPEACVTPGVYALVAAGATMCGVTRLSVTLAVILFELTGSLDHVLPFSLAVLVAKWTADFIEPLSIYDLLTEMNHYPFLDNKSHPIFTSELGDITPIVRSRRVIDISRSAKVPASELRRKLGFLQSAGEVDGGLPIVRDGLLVGLLPAPDLEFALDKLSEQYGMVVGAEGGGDGNGVDTDASTDTEILCQMAADDIRGWSDEEDDEETNPNKIADVTGYIDPAPVALDVHSPMDLVYQCFVKLGLRYICVTKDGSYAGMVHKKAFVKYIKDLEKGKVA